MVHDTEKFNLVLEQLRVMQADIASQRPDAADVDGRETWDQLEESMDFVRSLMKFNSPYVVRMRTPFWARERAAGSYYFHKIEVKPGNEQLPTSLENKDSVSRLNGALRFISLSAAETLAAMVGGEVISEQEAKELELRQSA